MKFTQGVWEDLENVSRYPAVEVYELSSSLSAAASSTPNPPNVEPYIKALCATRHSPQNSRGGLIGQPIVSVKLTAPSDGIIGIEATHFLGKGKYLEPRAELFPDGRGEWEGVAEVEIGAGAGSGSEFATISNGRATAIMDLRPDSFNIEFQDSEGRHLTKLGKETIHWIFNAAATPNLAPNEYGIQTGQDLYYRPPPTERRSYMSLAWGLEAGELVYGLGERFGPLIKNGQTIEMGNDDMGTSTLGGYKNVPFYLTNRCYGVLIDHFDHVSFEVQSEKLSKVQSSVPGETIRAYIMVGSSPKEVLTQYTLLTGRTPLPPSWSFGLWLSTSFFPSYKEEDVMANLDRMKSLNIPVAVQHFDPYYMRNNVWCDFQWDENVFPDPAGYLDRLHHRGVRICCWINPWVSQFSRLFKEGDEKGYFLKRRDGTTFQSDKWQPGCGTVDFTNPEAKKWWLGYLEDLLDLGVDTFKTDFGERITTEDVVWYDGSNPRTMHNYYTYLYNQAVYRLLIKKRGVDEACVFARSATIGSQKFPVHWGGDVDSEWTGMEETLRGVLSFGLSGFGYHASDIGGFKSEGTHGGNDPVPPPAAIYKRWVQFGLLSSHSRLHGSMTSRLPWTIDQESCSVLSKFTLLKNRLEPYLTSESILSVSALGHPIIRAMFLEFPEDKTCWFLDKQYMLGGDLLVAPVLNEETVEYWVPEGIWTNILTGLDVIGPRWVKEDHSFSTLPLLLRPGSVLVMGKRGHLVTDSILDKGLTVVVSKHFSEPTRVELALRGGKRITVELIPKVEDGEMAGLKVNLGGTHAPFDVVVVGGGRGLDDYE